ncbi:unnamed protein product, partial [Mycena citricolor]
FSLRRSRSSNSARRSLIRDSSRRRTLLARPSSGFRSNIGRSRESRSLLTVPLPTVGSRLCCACPRRFPGDTPTE